MADIVAVLYSRILKLDPQNSKWADRDRFLLSKGHAGAGIYAALAETGFFPVERLREHCQNGSYLSGHLSHQEVPGVEFSTGSLGHALSVACGMAFAAKLQEKPHRLFVLLGDGECDEGSVWEAALFASHHQLENLTVIVDANGDQSLATVEKTLRLEPFADKWRAFGWLVREVNGHERDGLISALEPQNRFPTCVIAKTIKGKGVSFMERQIVWHYRAPNAEELAIAIREVEASV